MEKYAHLAEITKSFLHGNLKKLTMEYDDPQHLHFNLSYEDNDYMFDYEFVIDKEKPEFEFIQHSCDKGVEHIDLRRQNDFEKEIFKYLFA